MLEPGAALSLANMILAAVGIALGNDQKHQDRVVAEILRAAILTPNWRSSMVRPDRHCHRGPRVQWRSEAVEALPVQLRNSPGG